MDKTIRILKELLDEYDEIEIPIVQRDYAQGRIDDHTNMVREFFLKDIKNAIEYGVMLDINFVYGKKIVVNRKGLTVKRFIPIDGQQRLTTLLLLHIFAFSKDDDKTILFKKFSYETRLSSREFLIKLIENRKDIFTGLKPSYYIKDSAWFHTSWMSDPTISGMLEMLDSIASMFSDVDMLSDKLWETENPCVIFHFIDIENLGQEDSLYIKLNERGKPLTEFENFKSKLIGELKKSGYKYEFEFERDFDMGWTDLFWSKAQGVKFDGLFLQFFECYFMNSKVIGNQINQNLKWTKSMEFNLTKIHIDELFCILNQIAENKLYQEKLFETLSNKSYENMLKFHCIVKYLIVNKKQSTEHQFNSWIRVMYNLINNTKIDSFDRYVIVMESINSMSEHSSEILELLQENTLVRGFAVDQLKEERIKATLILNSKGFAEAIYKAEKHPYFSGQIRSALYLSKKDNNYNLISFINYWEKISILFYKDKPKYENELRQALLAIGDYTENIGEYYTFCVNDPNEGSRTPSFKSFFSKTHKYLTQLLDSLTLNENIKCQLDQIIAQSDVPSDNWRFYFIKYPALFKLMSKSHLRIKKLNTQDIIIIPNKASNGYNYDVFLEALRIELIKKRIDFKEYIEQGARGYRALIDVKSKYTIIYKDKSYIIKENDKEIYKTSSTNPIYEVVEQISNKC